MNNKKTWYNNKWFLIIVLIVSIAIPFIINELYRWGNITEKGYHTLWGAADALGFYGTILSVIGTVYLGYVAIKQNDRIMQIEERIYNRDCNSDIIINNAEKIDGKHITLSNEEIVKYEIDVYLSLELTNYGNAILNEIKLDFGQGLTFTSHIVLPKDCTKYVFIGVPKQINNGSLVKCSFYSCNQICTYGDFILKKVGNEATRTHYHYYGLYSKNID